MQVRRTWWLATPRGFSPSACRANPNNPRIRSITSRASSQLTALQVTARGIEFFPLCAAKMIAIASGSRLLKPNVKNLSGEGHFCYFSLAPCRMRIAVCVGHTDRVIGLNRHRSRRRGKVTSTRLPLWSRLDFSVPPMATITRVARTELWCPRSAAHLRPQKAARRQVNARRRGAEALPDPTSVPTPAAQIIGRTGAAVGALGRPMWLCRRIRLQAAQWLGARVIRLVHGGLGAP
eukprot:COSAG06_NODE_67_length_26084_cov_784.027670_10_plen_235_part_00